MKILLNPTYVLLFFITNLISQSNCNPIPEVNFPGGRVIMSFDGNVHDDDDILALPYAAGLWWAAGLKDKVVLVEYNNHVCLTTITESDGTGAGAGDDSQNMRNSASGAISRFNYDPNIFFDYETRGHESTLKMAVEIEKSTAANPLWIIAGGPMETVWRGLERASKGHENVTIISHSSWNENHTHCNDAHNWYALKTKYTNRGVYFVSKCSDSDCNQPTGLNDQNGGFSSAVSNWTWMQNSGKEYNRWIFGRNPFGTSKFDPSDAGMSYFLITGGPFNGGKKTANHNDAKKLMENPCQAISPQVENALPLLSITSPLSGANLTAGSTLTVNLSASDNDGYISKHQIFVNGTLVDTDGTNYSPYSISNISAGTYNIKATVRDNEGGATSATIAVVVDNPQPTPPSPAPDTNPPPATEPIPTTEPVPNNGSFITSITAPFDGQVFDVGSTVSVNLSTNAPAGDISKHQIFVNNKLVDTDGTNYTPHKIRNIATGSYTIKSIVTHLDGNTNSDSVVINVQAAGSGENTTENLPPSNGNVPLLSFNSPTANQQVLSGSNVTVAITASSPDGHIVKHRIFVNGKLVDTDGSWFTPHKIYNIGSGSHIIKASVTDDSGATSSKSITINAVATPSSEDPSSPVATNEKPTVTILSPIKNQHYEAGSTVSVNLSASDTDGSIKKYQIFINGKLVDTDGSWFTPHKIINIKTGTYVVLAKVTDDKGATASQSTSFSVLASTQKQATVINDDHAKALIPFYNGDLAEKNSLPDDFLKISINPVKEGRLQIQQKGNRYLRIINLHGITIKELAVDHGTMEIDISGMAPGMYLLSSDINVTKFILH